MKKKLLSLFLLIVMAFSVTPVLAEEAPLTANTFTVKIDVLKSGRAFIPSTVKMTLSALDGTLLAEGSADVVKNGKTEIVFNVPEYRIGTDFHLTFTEGADAILYYDKEYGANEAMLAETYAYYKDNGELFVENTMHVSLKSVTGNEAWAQYSENFVNSRGIGSPTDYMIWVSKANFTVTIFERNEEDAWDCLRIMPCSIGAPGTPTVTGQFQYYQYQNKWDYGSYYCGPVMRFYGGYALHSVLVNNNGTFRDGRIGMMISHGCVRMLPEDIQWLTEITPLKTKVYVTNE